MGRHSASDDNVLGPAERESPFAKLLAPRPPSHAVGAVEDELATVRLPDLGAVALSPAEPDVDAVAEPDVDAVAEPDVDGLGESGELGASDAASVPDAVTAPVPAGAGARTEQHSGTRGDLQLLRESSVLRLRCAAAVVVPFLLYTVLLIVIGRTDVYLIWFWIPTVLAGILIGAFLDAAHHRRARRERANASVQ